MRKNRQEQPCYIYGLLLREAKDPQNLIVCKEGVPQLSFTQVGSEHC
jgi:hypothetical protein